MVFRVSKYSLMISTAGTNVMPKPEPIIRLKVKNKYSMVGAQKLRQKPSVPINAPTMMTFLLPQCLQRRLPSKPEKSKVHLKCQVTSKNTFCKYSIGIYQITSDLFKYLYLDTRYCFLYLYLDTFFKKYLKKVSVSRSFIQRVSVSRYILFESILNRSGLHVGKYVPDLFKYLYIFRYFLGVSKKYLYLDIF